MTREAATAWLRKLVDGRDDEPAGDDFQRGYRAALRDVLASVVDQPLIWTREAAERRIGLSHAARLMRDLQ